MPKAYVFTQYGGPETEALVEVDRPAPGPGQILVAVRAAGVNPVDWKIRNGLRRPGEGERVFPAVLGSEVSGVVEEIGEGVAGFAVGDEVFGNTAAGGYAEYALLPATVTAVKPATLSFADAATLPVAAATAYDGIRQLDLPAGATVLVTGAGGGVGAAVLQIARTFGLRVVGVASDGKKDFVESLGAVHVPSGPDWAVRARAAAGPEGVDAVYDLVGGEVLSEAAGLLADRTAAALPADGAKHVTDGTQQSTDGTQQSTDGTQQSTDRTTLITAGASPEEAALLGGARVARARTTAVLEAVARLVVDGELTPHVTAVFPLDRAGEALRTVEDGHARGKVVIEVVR